jgi:hypothetical protein
MAIAAIVLGLSIAGWWIMSLNWIRSREDEEELPEVSLPAHLHEVISGIPPALKVFYVFIAASLVFYLLFAWLGGVTY